MRRTRTPNTVRTPDVIAFSSSWSFSDNGRRNGNNDCGRCGGCGPHGRNAVGDPSSSSTSYRSCHTSCLNQFLRFSPSEYAGRSVSLASFSLKMNVTTTEMSIKNPNERLHGSNSRKEGCLFLPLVLMYLINWPSDQVIVCCI